VRVRWGGGFILFLAVIFLQNELIYTFIFLCAALIHEAGHLVCLKALGTKKPELSLGLCGAVIRVDTRSLSYRSEAAVYLSGAAANSVFAALSLLVLGQGFRIRLAFFFFANLFYAVLNLLPLRNFDGGRAFECILLLLFDPFTVEKAVRWVYAVSSALLFAGSVYSVTVFGLNPTLVAVSLWALFQCIPSKPCCLSAS